MNNSSATALLSGTPVTELEMARNRLFALEIENKRLREALQALFDAEWMIAHPWGGDREAVLNQARAALGVEL